MHSWPTSEFCSGIILSFERRTHQTKGNCERIELPTDWIGSNRMDLRWSAIESQPRPQNDVLDYRGVFSSSFSTATIVMIRSPFGTGTCRKKETPCTHTNARAPHMHCGA